MDGQFPSCGTFLPAQAAVRTGLAVSPPIFTRLIIRSAVLYCLLPGRLYPMNGASGPAKSSPAKPIDQIIRFGSFEVDIRASELRRSGLKVKLSGQPFDVLVALLEKPGQVVTREELHEKLWSHDTFVDFEQGLNKAINKVRDAL